MDYLAINKDYMVSAEVDYMTEGKYHGHYRVITRDLDADRIIAVRYWPRHLRDVAIVYADGMVDGKTIDAARITVDID